MNKEELKQACECKWWKQLNQLKKENEELKNKLQQKENLNKEMCELYKKINGNSLIEKSVTGGQRP